MPGALLIAAAAYLSCALIASRPMRHQTQEFEATLPAPIWLRAMAQAATVGSVALAVLALASLRLLLMSGVGRVMVSELVNVALVVLVAGLIGYAFGSLARGFILPIVGLVALVALGFAGYVSDDPTLGTWTLGAGINPFFQPPLPASVMGRAGWGRAAWLLAIAVAIVAWQTLSSRVERRALAAGAAALSLVVGAVALQTDLSTHTTKQLADREKLRQDPSPSWRCQQRAGVTYCPMEGFGPRVTDWSATVNGITSRLPPGAVPRLGIYQAVPVWLDADGMALPVPTGRWQAHTRKGTVPVPVSTRWASPGAVDFNQTGVIGLAADVAYSTMTGNSSMRSTASTPMCTGRDGLMLYLARSATPASESAYQTLQAHSSGGGFDIASMESSAGYFFGDGATNLSEALMQRPRDQVTKSIKANWARVRSGSLTVEEAARLLGVPAPSTDGDRGTVCARP